MRIRSLSAWVAVTAVVAAVVPANASASTITFDEPVTGGVMNDCTGDMVFIDGTMHSKFTSNSSLTTAKSEIEMNFLGVKGTTATGVRYVMNNQMSDMQHADIDPSGNAQVTIENTTNLTRQGESGELILGDDFRLHEVTHLTVVNGAITSAKHDLSADCR